jgi:hypothetical protein
MPISFAPKYRPPGGIAGKVRSQTFSPFAIVRAGSAAGVVGRPYVAWSAEIASLQLKTARAVSLETNTGRTGSLIELSHADSNDTMPYPLPDGKYRRSITRGDGPHHPG